MFGNEIGPGLLQFSVRQARVLQEYQTHKARATDYVSILSVLCEIFADFMLFEGWTGELQPNLVFEMRNNFIFGIPY